MGIWNSKIQIVVGVGNLAEEKADVLVNTIGAQAKLVAGNISYAIVEGGGNALQEELDEHCPYGVKVGGIAQTNGGNLKCKKVFHVVLKQWMNVNDEAEKLLYSVVYECLQWASKQNFTSITFPALGTGFNRFPGKRSAEIIFRAFETYQRRAFFSSLEIVKVVIHPRDKLNCLEFTARRDGLTAIHENFILKNIVLKQQDEISLGLKLQVVVGCLSQLEADVLVNTTQSDLNLTVGAVSRTLIEKGGTVIQQECRKNCPEGFLREGNMVQTQGGNLHCQKVFHVVVPPWHSGRGNSEERFQALVLKCLKEASKQAFRSLGLPLLGTGFLKYPASKSMELLLKTISVFLKEEDCRSLETISVVVAHKDIDVRKAVLQQLDGKGKNSSTTTSAVVQSSSLIVGEKEALAGNGVQYFPLLYGKFSVSSAEEVHFQTVQRHFFEFLIKDDVNRHIYRITKIEYVVNPDLIRCFRDAEENMRARDPAYGTSVLAYHGTAEENIKSICEEGFRLPTHEKFTKTTDIGWYGNGIYFSEYPRFAMNYMQGSKKLLLCKVLQGRIYKCGKLRLGEHRIPEYDSHVDPFGKEIVIFDNNCILPCYIVHFDICKRFKRIDDKADPNDEDDTELKYLNEMAMHKGEKKPV